MEWELKSGDTIDGWTLKMRLKPGGNGEVWVAHHAELGEGALKLLKLKYQGEGHKRYLRFRDEATMHGRLAEQHAGVLPFLGCSLPENPTRDMPAWLATSVAVPIRETLAGRAVREAVEAVTSVAETLATLHEQGISHRDIKPENLFKYEDRWVIGDFGLVDYPDKGSVTDTGERLGPYHYLAPEMQDEASSSDGCKADVYSLGKTLWVLATEQYTPRPGEQRADNSQLNVGAYRTHPSTRQLDLLIERSTRHNPNDRPMMIEFAAELRAWLATPRVQAHPDLSDVLARIRASAAPSLRAHQERLRQANEAEALRRRFAHQLMLPIVKAFMETGIADNGIKELESIDTLFMRSRPLDMPTVFWQRGLTVTAHKRGAPIVWSAEGADWSKLICGVGIEVRVDGTIVLFGGYTIKSIYGPEFIGFQEYVAPVGSSLQEKAVSDLFSQLMEALPRALERFVQRMEADRKLPSTLPKEAEEIPP